MSERREAGGRPRSAPRVPQNVRRAGLAVVLLGLAAANVWYFRREFPGGDRRRNEAYDRGLVALDARKFGEAVLHFQRFLEMEPRNRRVRMLLAQSLAAKGDMADARMRYQEVIDDDENSDDARMGIAEIARLDQDYDEAFRQLAAARAKDPTPPMVWAVSGRVQAEAGDIDGAIEMFRTAVQLDAGLFDAQLTLGDLLLARSALTGSVSERVAAQGCYRAAEDALRSRSSNAFDARLGLALAKALAGQARAGRKQGLADAVTQLRRVAAADPDDPSPTLFLAEILVNAGDVVEARRTLDEAIRKWNTPLVATAYHTFLAARGETAEALRVLERAVTDHREDAALRVRLIGFLVETDRLDDAERELTSAETILADDPRVIEARGDLERELERIARDGRKEDEALRHSARSLEAYTRALQLRPRSPRVKKKLAAQWMDAAARGGGVLSPEAQQARKFIDDVLRVNPTDPEALEWRGQMLASEGRWKEVAELLRPLAKSPGASPGTLRLLGVAAARIGADDLAADSFVALVDRLSPPAEDGSRDGTRVADTDWQSAVTALLRAGRADVALRLAQSGRSAWPDSPRTVAALATVRLTAQDIAGALADLKAAPTRFPKDVEVRTLYAQTLEAAGRVDEAESAWKAMLTEMDTDEVRLRFFEFLVRTGRAEAAEDGFIALVAADAKNPESHLRLGDFYLSQIPPKRDAAMRSYEKALALEPGNPAPLLRLADAVLGDAERDPSSITRAQEYADRYDAAAPNDPFSGYLRGKILLALGKGDEALARLEAFANLRPEAPAGQYYYAKALRSVGRLEDALGPMERASRLRPRDAALRLELAQLQFELGSKAFERGDFAAARVLLARADDGGARQGARFLLAGAAANMGELDVSEAECRKSLARVPDDQATQHLLAAILMRRGTKASVEEAELIYRAVRTAHPNDLLAQVGVASIKFLRGLYDDAMAEFKAMYPKTGGEPGIALAIAQCYVAKQESLEAVKFLEAEAAAHPTSAAFPHMLGDFLVNAKQYDQAVKQFKRAAELDPTNDVAVIAAAAALVEANRSDEGRALLEQRLPTAKTPAPILLAIGELLLRAGRVPEGAAQIRRALSLAPDQTRAMYLLGRVAELEGQPADAKRLYADAVAKGAFEPDCFIRLARLRQSEGEADKARDLYLRALRFDPRNASTLNSLALLVSRDEARLEEAMGYASRALALLPNSSEVLDTFGWIQFRRGEPDLAVLPLMRAADGLPKSAAVQYHAGVVCARLRRDAEARVYLERALRVEAGFADAAACRKELDALPK